MFKYLKSSIDLCKYFKPSHYQLANNFTGFWLLFFKQICLLFFVMVAEAAVLLGAQS